MWERERSRTRVFWHSEKQICHFQRERERKVLGKVLKTVAFFLLLLIALSLTQCLFTCSLAPTSPSSPDPTPSPSHDHCASPHYAGNICQVLFSEVGTVKTLGLFFFILDVGRWETLLSPEQFLVLICYRERKRPLRHFGEKLLVLQEDEAEKKPVMLAGSHRQTFPCCPHPVSLQLLVSLFNHTRPQKVAC